MIAQCSTKSFCRTWPKPIVWHNGSLAMQTTPKEISLYKADAEDVQQALAQLPAQYREVIVLREINQLNYRDIAEITNVPIGTVMSRLSRGRQYLMALLGDRR